MMYMGARITKTRRFLEDFNTDYQTKKQDLIDGKGGDITEFLDDLIYRSIKENDFISTMEIGNQDKTIDATYANVKNQFPFLLVI